MYENLEKKSTDSDIWNFEAEQSWQYFLSIKIYIKNVKKSRKRKTAFKFSMDNPIVFIIVTAGLYFLLK